MNDTRREQDIREDSDMLCMALGYLQTWADELEKIKTRVLLPLASGQSVVASLQGQFDFDTVDRIVCQAREMNRTQQERWERRIHGM